MINTAWRFYGRRKGHRLGPNRQRLIKELLPRLRLDTTGGLLDLERLFARSVQEIWLEIGFGAGEHLAGQAQEHPGIGFIGCEPFINGVAALLSCIASQGLDNLRLLDDDARYVFDVLPEASLGKVFILFPDPWPKMRHAKRRFISSQNLDKLAYLLKNGAELRVISDDMGYIRWSLHHVCAHPAFQWTAKRPDDWRMPPGDHLPTRYEQKALEKGDICIYLNFHRLPRKENSPEQVSLP